jgi:outer membrane biogenesis lipoprotein LolB
MKKLFLSALLGVLCASALFLLPGCATTGSAPATTEAKVYYSFADTWAVAKTAYAGYCELAVQGKVSVPDQADVDAAWDKFRGAFKLAFTAASRDWNTATPADVQQLSDDLLILIRSL